MGNEFTIYGGIRFRKDEVDSYSNKQKNGRMEFTVKLKTGQILIFGDQYDPRGKLAPSVSSHNEHGRPWLTGNDLNGVTIIGNPSKRDYIEITGESSLNSIYVDNDKLKDDVYIHKNYRYNSKTGQTLDINEGNFLHLGKEDKKI